MSLEKLQLEVDMAKRNEMIDNCNECGSDALNWDYHIVNNSGVVDGKLRTHDISFIYILSCEVCGTELGSLSPDEVSLRLLNYKGK